jgi:DNA (cytosine-5)-methyltransferase 1
VEYMLLDIFTSVAYESTFLELILKSKKTAVSLFSGCGGFCEGVELAGFDIKCAVELDRFAAETYRYNFEDIPLVEDDIKNFLKRGSDDVQKYDLRDIDLVFGGPPCQGFSQIGTRDLEDDRNQLYIHFARVVDTLQPRVFVMENVPNILLMNKGHYRDKIIKKFVSIGYRNTTFVKVSAADYGVPQLRHRVMFIGTRDHDRLPFDLRSLANSILAKRAVKKPYTVKDAIDDLPKKVVASGETMPYPDSTLVSDFQKIMRLDFSQAPYSSAKKKGRGLGRNPMLLFNHHTKEIQERRARLIALLKPGLKADSLPKRIWNGKRPEKWRRLDPKEPAYTILAHMHRDLSEWVHPSLNRWITVREAARLQSFHDGFIFRGSEWQQLKQIGNAVPPLLAYAVGSAVAEVLDELQTNKPRANSSGQMVQSLPAQLKAA